MIHLALFLIATLVVVTIIGIVAILLLDIAIDHSRTTRIIFQTIAGIIVGLFVGIFWNNDGHFHQIPAFITAWIIILQPFIGDDLKHFVDGEKR